MDRREPTRVEAPGTTQNGLKTSRSGITLTDVPQSKNSRNLGRFCKSWGILGAAVIALHGPNLFCSEFKTPRKMDQFWDMVAKGDIALAQKQLLLMRDRTADDMLTRELLTAFLYYKLGDQVTMYMCMEAVDSLLYAAYVSKTITLPSANLPNQ